MEEESQINFRALRAKFQEEALLAQTKTTRPTVAEKPKNLPPAGGHCSSVVSSINIATENKTTVVPRVIFRNELRASGGKRSTSSPAQPPQLSPSSQPINGDGTTKKQSFKERHMPQVLPVLCSKEHRFDPLIKKESPQEQELVKEVPQIKPKKNNLLLALKSSRVSKFSPESEEEPTYAELTTRPASAPGELPSVEKQTSEDGVSLQGDQLPATRHLSSPDVSVTPPLLEMSVDSDNRIISTLERAKRKFSCRHILISSKSKSLRSPDFASSERPFLSSPRNMENTEPDLPPLPPPPVGLPHLACISARPFSKVNNSARKPAFIKPYRPDKAERPSVTTDLPSHSTPQKNPLPDLRLLGPKPAKPRRPPLVSLRHDQKTVHEVLKDLSQEPSKGSESEKPTSSAVLDAPVFPDFENPETERTQIAAVDIAALDLKVLDLGGLGSPPPAPADRGVPESKTSQFDTRTSEVASESSVAQQLKVGSLSGIPSHPASFPEPSNLTDSITRDRRSPSEDVIVPPPPTPRADEAELAAAESRCARDETELRLQTAPTNEDTRTRASDQNYECDNVYEDVENINKFFLCQNSRKQKGNLKNPYADNNLPAKEEVSLHIWPRNPWGSISGEHSSHNLVHGKERQTPNTTADYKELKKREKQRLEKEKKEQKEREKKENEMKKKFKVTGDEEPMYHAKVMVASKVRKNDLPVKSGDTVSIIRTTNCPKGKWLARDASHKYGYISVMNVELNIKEMLELGKKAQAAGRVANPDGDTISIGSRSSSHLVVTSSFTDDSEEWACEDETLSACYASHIPHQTTSLAEAYDLASNQHTLSHANVEDLHTQNDEYLSTRKRHEALQKLAIFFEQSKDEFGDVTDSGAPTPTNPDPPSFLCAVEEPPYPEQEVDFSDLGLLPPPPLYADTD